MRHLLASLLLLVALSSCTILHPEKALVRGSVWAVSQNDMHLAIAAARKGDPKFASAPVYQIIVSGRSELFVYFGPTDNDCAIVRRVDRQWRYIATAEVQIIVC